MVKDSTILLIGGGAAALYLLSRSSVLSDVSEVTGGVGEAVGGLGSGIGTIGREAGALAQEITSPWESISQFFSNITSGLEQKGEQERYLRAEVFEETLPEKTQIISAQDILRTEKAETEKTKRAGLIETGKTQVVEFAASIGSFATSAPSALIKGASSALRKATTIFQPAQLFGTSPAPSVSIPSPSSAIRRVTTTAKTAVTTAAAKTKTFISSISSKLRKWF
jgi:hypothetical protein